MHSQHSFSRQFIVIIPVVGILPLNCATLWLSSHFFNFCLPSAALSHYYGVCTITGCSIIIVGVLYMFMDTFCHHCLRVVHINTHDLSLHVYSSAGHRYHWCSVFARLVLHPYYYRVIPSHWGVSLPGIGFSAHHQHHWRNMAPYLPGHHYCHRAASFLFWSSLFWIHRIQFSIVQFTLSTETLFTADLKSLGSSDFVRALARNCSISTCSIWC